MLIGIVGGGQLGRMLALAGYPLGLRFRVLDPSPDAPAGRLAEHITAAYDDAPALARFAQGLDVITYEFENVPVQSARLLAQHGPVWPPPAALETAQDRLHEKTCFQQLGIPTPRFAPISAQADLPAALAHTGLPAVLKTRRLGYDGKGQVVVHSAAAAAAAWEQLGGKPLILEAFVAYTGELSLLAARSPGGATAFYPLVANTHRAGILAQSRCPAPLPPAQLAALQALAEDYMARLLAHLEYVGLLALELFQAGDGLLANEMAPRVHNSGHWTIEGAVTSQFANHLRAILDWPLGDTQPRGHSAMVNIIGARPDPASLLALPGAALHLYDKAPRPGRKLGHVTLCAADAATLESELAQPALAGLCVLA
jgi:5-(carboxyamino)imidazole ribonucleotide synthase